MSPRSLPIVPPAFPPLHRCYAGRNHGTNHEENCCNMRALMVFFLGYEMNEVGMAGVPDRRAGLVWFNGGVCMYIRVEAWYMNITFFY